MTTGSTYKVVELVPRARGRKVDHRLLRDWTSVMGNTEATIRGLDLEHDHIYRIQVKARNGEDMWSRVGSSQRIQADLTPPTTPTLRRYNHWTAIAQRRSPAPASISVWWNAARDPESDIREYQFSIKREPSPGWNPNDFSVATGNLSFWHMGEPLAYLDTFYVHVVAVNNAGSVSEVAISDPIVPNDLSPPTPPTVFVSTFQAQTNFVELNIGNTRDPETGIAGYKYAIGRQPGGDDARAWSEQPDIVVPRQGSKRAIGLNLRNGRT